MLLPDTCPKVQELRRTFLPTTVASCFLANTSDADDAELTRARPSAARSVLLVSVRLLSLDAIVELQTGRRVALVFLLVSVLEDERALRLLPNFEIGTTVPSPSLSTSEQLDSVK